MHKMEQKKVMSSFDIYIIVRELKGSLIGTYLDNIYQINEDTFLLRFRPGNQTLVVQVGKRIHLTEYSMTIPSAPTQFCMALRKYLRDGKVVDISQHHFERIVSIQFASSEGRFQMVVELFSRGNLILVDENLKIVLALRYARMRDRDVVRHGVFTHAPSSGLSPIAIDRNHVASLKYSEPMPIARKLTKLLAIGGQYAQEITARAHVSDKTPSNLLSDNQIDTIYEAIKMLASDLQSDRTTPQIVLGIEGSPLTVQPFTLMIHNGRETKNYLTFNQAADEYFSKQAHIQKETTQAENTQREKEKISRILEMQTKEITTLQKEIVSHTEIGETIRRHAQEIDLLIGLIQDERSRGSTFADIADSLIRPEKRGQIPQTIFRHLDAKNRVARVELEGKEFPIEFEQSPYRNASNYFDKAKDLKTKLENVEKSIVNTKSELETLKSKVEEETRAEVPLSRRREKEWFEKFHWFESSEGFLVLAGRDSSTNELLVNHYTDNEDVVFHAEIQGAPFVTVKTAGRKPGDSTISEAAVAAASYSRAWSSGFASADVYWVNPEQLSKKPPSGQYLGKGMFMVYGTRNYVKGVSVRVAIGVLEKENELRLIGGPRTAVEAKTHSFVELCPGKTRSAALAKKILYLLSKKVPDNVSKIVRTLSLEEVQRMIPAGTGDIVE